MEKVHLSSGSTDTVILLTELSDRVVSRPEYAGLLPEELVRSARRFVELSGIDGLPGEPVVMVPARELTTSQLVVQLIRQGEVVNAGKLHGRLARAGRIVAMGYIATLLHRAHQRGVLARVSKGHYERVGDATRSNAAAAPRSYARPDVTRPGRAGGRRRRRSSARRRPSGPNGRSVGA